MGYSARRGANKGFRAEVRVARRLRAKRVGGPGRPDLLVKGVPAEVKNWSARAVHAGQIEKAYRHGSRVVIASGRKGFSRGAKAVAEELGIRLRYVRSDGTWRALKRFLWG